MQSTNNGVVSPSSNGAISRSNFVLTALPAADYQRLLPHLKAVHLPSGRVLREEGAPIERVYFLSKGLVSIVLTSVNGTEVEVGMVGREGVVGSLAVLSDRPSLSRHMVQVEGEGHQMPLSICKEEFHRGGRFQEMMLAHFQMMFTDSSQSALCNRLHSVEQRLCRWLLTVRDRIDSDKLSLTHEFIANMLGSRRPGVTVALTSVEEAGLISHKRGCITIVDGDGMEEMACECYGNVREQYESYLRQFNGAVSA